MDGIGHCIGGLAGGPRQSTHQTLHRNTSGPRKKRVPFPATHCIIIALIAYSYL